MWKWFRSTYDPLSGEMTKNSAPGGGQNRTFKAHKVEIIQLDNTLEPHSSMELYGVYPKSWKASEMNYATNEMHTIEVTFRYDFLNQFNINTDSLV